MKPSAAAHDASAVIRHVSRVGWRQDSTLGLFLESSARAYPRRQGDDRLVAPGWTGDSRIGHQIIDMHKQC